eukprot:695052-Alexandrium_andersonii.AAC.1
MSLYANMPTSKPDVSDSTARQSNRTRDDSTRNKGGGHTRTKKAEKADAGCSISQVAPWLTPRSTRMQTRTMVRLTMRTDS